MWFLRDKLESYTTPQLRTVLEGLILLITYNFNGSDLTFDNICVEPRSKNSDLQSFSLCPLLQAFFVGGGGGGSNNE